jgi:ferric-dicitrate binding protein FerR (iron transport regulator)
VARFAWRRFGQRFGGTGGHEEHDVVSDLVMVAPDRSERRAGFSFPGGFPAGPAVATCLQWAHETWFADGSAYRTAGVEVERPRLSILRGDGCVERLDKPSL